MCRLVEVRPSVKVGKAIQMRRAIDIPHAVRLLRAIEMWRGFRMCFPIQTRHEDFSVIRIQVRMIHGGHVMGVLHDHLRLLQCV